MFLWVTYNLGNSYNEVLTGVLLNFNFICEDMNKDLEECPDKMNIK